MTKLSTPIIVVVEHDAADVLTGASIDALRVGANLTTGPLLAVANVPEPDVAQLGSLGVESVFKVPSASARLTAPVASGVTVLVEQLDATPAGVLLPPTYWGKELAGALAVKLGAGAVTDVDALAVNDGHIVASKTVLGGSWTTRFELVGGVPAISLAPTIAVDETDERASTTPEVTALQDVEDGQVAVLTSIPLEGDAGAALADAEVAVVGGRGTDGNFELVQELADVLGGAVGATRDCCDEGWADRSVQVGQTGITISPRLYVGLGVSGAIHHTCGIQGSGAIVAVCDDPDAPIFELADFGVVGDLNDVVPAAIERLRELQSQ